MRLRPSGSGPHGIRFTGHGVGDPNAGAPALGSLRPRQPDSRSGVSP
jgi:hypothetical protein